MNINDWLDQLTEWLFYDKWLTWQTGIVYLEGELSVDGGHLGGHVHRGRGVRDEVLYGLVSVPLPTGHQVEYELEQRTNTQDVLTC